TVAPPTSSTRAPERRKGDHASPEESGGVTGLSRRARVRVRRARRDGFQHLAGAIWRQSERCRAADRLGRVLDGDVRYTYFQGASGGLCWPVESETPCD